ncbi:AHH domain-containing protein [Bradyrhizobium stylosanthis]|uniref:HNH/ENDO VII superfamily nuclease n=1 Tax=Bradyrhizobium stylosanthis TaxID=1803665 RepID=A0A560DYI7_9BRAD|nr:AHH domain-containing protein [Bradyrhizobium stylosanthis]TWB02113.1 HNH/ENDO VII superfamily nuclease [Bradyrhizobium stylosanthis]
MFQIHHILPQALAGHFTLKVLGDRFNLNGIRNLMDLPSNEQAARELGSSPHTGGHLGSYSRIFCKFLGVLQSHPSFAAAQEGDSAAVDQLDAELSSFLAAAKHALSKGHLLANTPLGMTKEDANKRIEDWYVNWKTYAEENRDSIKQMQDTVDQLHTASQWEGALRAPVLLPDSTLSLADKLAIIGRYTRGSPISQHFEAVGPVPHLPGFIHPVIDARLPSLSSLSGTRFSALAQLTPWRALRRSPPILSSPSTSPSAGSRMSQGSSSGEDARGRDQSHCRRNAGRAA